MMKIYLKCSTNFLKDFKLLTLKKKRVNLPKMNKLIWKISDICWTRKLRAFSKKKQNYWKKLITKKLI